MPRRDTTDITKLRYVLYARKSTEDETRQVRSIDDQIRDCQKLALELGLNVVGEPIRETKSAKRPGQRPKFTQMLKDIENKKYDAILCWHPDRLSRNMLEGGQIINMLDESVLKDIRFHSHQFSNDANGKMLLGMLFVFSKQYSDDLSDKVSRGVAGNLSEGKSGGTPKLGYTRNDVSGLYEPNDYHYAIKEAWQRRLEGQSVDAITQYLTQENVHRVTKRKQGSRILRPSKSTVANMFHDPFYYGTLIQADQSVDLCELYNFEPVVTRDEYEQIQLLGYGRTKDQSATKRTTYYPLRGFVYCAVCDSPVYMKVGKNKTGSGKYVLSYRCDNKQCTRAPRSLRAKHIFNSIYEMLDKIELTDEAYTRYSNALDGMTEEKLLAIKQDIHSKRGVLAQLVKKINEIALGLGRLNPQSPAYKPNEAELERLSSERDDLQEKIDKLQEKVAQPARIKLDKDEFLNLVKTVADKMRAGSAAEKDALCRILFLNLRVDNEKVVDYLWKEPFDTLVKSTENYSGGAGWT